MIFKKILGIAFMKRQNQDLDNISMRMGFIEIAHNLLQNPSSSLRSNSRFINFLKKQIIRPLMKNCTSTNLSLISNSLSLFYFIIKYFRSHFLDEISVFILDIVIPMIESVNNRYPPKSLMVKILRNIVQEPKISIDFFVNFDSNKQRSNILEKIILTLTKVAKGKFAKSEYSNTVTKEEEEDIKKLSTTALVKMTGSIDSYVENELRSGKNIVTLETKPKTKREKNIVKQLKRIQAARDSKQQETEAIEKFNLKIKHGI